MGENNQNEKNNNNNNKYREEGVLNNTNYSKQTHTYTCGVTRIGSHTDSGRVENKQKRSMSCATNCRTFGSSP